MDHAAELRAKFTSRFGQVPTLYRAPGRVNLIGEHTDYNDGYVLPAAIGFYCRVAGSTRGDRKLVIHSANMDETAGVALNGGNLQPTRRWPDYPLGVAWALSEDGYSLDGANLYIQSEVPLGSGLSSSAALEVSVAYALLDLSGQPIDRMRVVKACVRAENEFVGARSGMMDQFISCYGRAGHAILLDCRSLDFQMLPLPASIRLGICNTMVKHEISAGEYNARRRECEDAVARLAKELPGIRSLRDVASTALQTHRDCLTETLYKRARHVVSENERTPRAAQALQQGDLRTFGRLSVESHHSLREDYQVSCEELDLMVELALQQRGVYGARMTGGGFGGCTINLVEAAAAPEFQRRMAEAYFAATGRQPDIYICEAAEGARPIMNGES